MQEAYNSLESRHLALVLLQFKNDKGRVRWHCRYAACGTSIHKTGNLRGGRNRKDNDTRVGNPAQSSTGAPMPRLKLNTVVNLKTEDSKFFITAYLNQSRKSRQN